MSYEGDLVASYDAAHKRLLGTPPAIKKTPPLVPHHSIDKNSLAAILLRIEAIEERITQLESKKHEVNPENIVINYPLHTQAVSGFLGEIFKLVRKNEQDLDPSTDLRSVTIFGPSRKKDVSRVRHIMYYLMSNMTDRSLPEIGRFLKRDHTSVLHGKRVIERLIKADPRMEIKMRWYQAEIARMLAIRCGQIVDIGDSKTTLVACD